MKILQFNPYQCGAGRGWGKAGQIGSEKSKPIPALPNSARPKSCPIPTLPPLRGRKNPCEGKQEKAGQNCHPYLLDGVKHGFYTIPYQIQILLTIVKLVSPHSHLSRSTGKIIFVPTTNYLSLQHMWNLLPNFV